MKKIILTCITNDYDYLKEPEVPLPGWELHCFTDKPEICEGTSWTAHHYAGSNRDVKMLSHKFVDYDLCLWIDGSIGITSDLDWFSELFETDKHLQLLLSQHPARHNPVDEIKHCIAVGKGRKDVLSKQLVAYQALGLNGLYQMGMHIKRNADKVNRLMEAWHAEYSKYPSRDQPAFVRALSLVPTPNKVIHFRRYKKHFSYFPLHKTGMLTTQQTKPFVNWIQPYSSTKQYGAELNRMIERLPDDEWVGITDQDVCFLQHFTKKLIEDCIKRYPDTHMFSGITNRLGLHYQLHEGNASEVADIKYHAKICRERELQYGNLCRQIHNPVAGFMMVFPKYVWQRIKFIDGITDTPGDRGPAYFDWIFSSRVLELGGITRLMLGVYVFHYYRFLEGGQLYTKHLDS